MKLKMNQTITFTLFCIDVKLGFLQYGQEVLEGSSRILSLAFWFLRIGGIRYETECVQKRGLERMSGNAIGRGAAGGREQCHKEELSNSCSLSNVKMIRSRRATWAGCITDRRDEKGIQYFWSENLKA
jgi:hypothetical protein